MAYRQNTKLDKSILGKIINIVGVSNGHAIKDIRNFVGLDDVAKIVEKRRMKFMDRLIDSGVYGTVMCCEKMTMTG